MEACLSGQGRQTGDGIVGQGGQRHRTFHSAAVGVGRKCLVAAERHALTLRTRHASARWVRHRFDIGSPAELCHPLRPGCARPGLLPQPPQCSLTPQSLRFRAKLGLHIIHFEGKFPSPRTWIPDGTGSGYRRALLDELWRQSDRLKNRLPAVVDGARS